MDFVVEWTPSIAFPPMGAMSPEVEGVCRQWLCVGGFLAPFVPRLPLALEPAPCYGLLAPVAATAPTRGASLVARRGSAARRDGVWREGALRASIGWPPASRRAAVAVLERHRAPELLRHLDVVGFARRDPAGLERLLGSWREKGIRPPDAVFGAYYFYALERERRAMCLKHNGRGQSAGHGRGCDYALKGPNFRCRYEHRCLFCMAPNHGWFDEDECERYAALQREMNELGVTESDALILLDALEQKESIGM